MLKTLTSPAAKKIVVVVATTVAVNVLIHVAAKKLEQKYDIQN